MPDIKYFTPAPGRLVRDPITGRPLPAEGMHVNLGDAARRNFYTRRLRDGDVNQGQPPAPSAPAPPQTEE